MLFSLDFLIDFCERDIPSIGHDPRNWIGTNCGVSIVEVLDKFDNWLYGPEHNDQTTPIQLGVCAMWETALQ